MKKNYSICLVCLALVGCASAKSSTDTHYQLASVRHYEQNKTKLDTLYKSCTRDQDHRLEAADSVMELIMQNHIQKDGTVVITQKDRDYQASEDLEKLVGRFYDENITVNECKTAVQAINNSLLGISNG